MAENTKIEWTQSTWNPWHGCHKVSAGCKNCYMFREKKYYGQDPNVVVRSKTKFYDPLKWKEPRRIFTCSWSDFFIEEADPWRDESVAIMALTPQHTYQVLTKRPDRMLEYLTDRTLCGRVAPIAGFTAGALRLPMEMAVAGQRLFVSLTEDYNRGGLFQLPNVWLGVSVEDQKTADERIPLLLKTPAALRWLSIEPLLEYVRIKNEWLKQLDWIVIGGESGPGARPFDVKWPRTLIRQCSAAGVPVFVKQLGANVWDVNDAGYEGDTPQEWPMDTDTDDWHLDPSRQYQGAPCRVMLGDRKGGNMNEWPEDLRIREMPEAVTRPVGSVPR